MRKCNGKRQYVLLKKIVTAINNYRGDHKMNMFVQEDV